MDHGGLGLQHPRFSAASSLVLTTRQCISYATRGIYLPTQSAPTLLPPEYACLYSQWDSPTTDSTVFAAYRHYAHQLLATADATDPNLATPATDQLRSARRLVADASADTLKREHRHAVTQALLANLEDSSAPDVAEYLPSILQPHTSAALIGMSRLRRQDRLPNDLFYVALMRLLRIPFWSPATAPRCRSGGRVDVYNDIFFSAASYTRPNKRRAHDAIRDCLRNVLKKINVIANYAPHTDNVHRGEAKLIDAAPSRRPLDVSFDIDKTCLASSSNHSTLDKFGLDVTLITYEPHSSSTATRTPKLNRLHAHRTGERSKLTGNGYTDKDTQVTISRD